ncbi:isochorismatase domain-containing protein 2-like [Ixodes scapularis]|uniref:isochorismatase domain-containing protein 2-like n=1 Tax=Ixodes scapularis TaxID=6945 RepID=UPI001C3822CF|nr:isochorismatase domain-containing protein 2-like [Ixodes scapularis]
MVPEQKTAIFLCDMQNKFQNTVRYFPDIVTVSQRLLKAGKSLDMPVTVTEQHPEVVPAPRKKEKKSCLSAFPELLFGFERMKARGAWLTTSESVILGLLGGSADPKFMEFHKLFMEPAPDSGLLGFPKIGTLHEESEPAKLTGIPS